MAFAVRNLSVLAYANGFTLWHYKAEAEALGAVAAGGFFEPAAGMMVAGDILMVSASDGARVLVLASSGPVLLTAPLS